MPGDGQISLPGLMFAGPHPVSCAAIPRWFFFETNQRALMRLRRGSAPQLSSQLLFSHRAFESSVSGARRMRTPGGRGGEEGGVAALRRAAQLTQGGGVQLAFSPHA